MTFARSIFAALALFAALAGTAGAAVKLSAEVGWDGQYRAGRWTPVYITAASDPPRNAVLNVSAPHSSAFGMSVRRGISMSARPATYPLYLPMGSSLYELQITLTDAETGRRLADWPDRESGPQNFASGSSTNGALIGTSGPFGPVGSIQFEQTPTTPALGNLPPLLLPSAGVGYDSLDLLILDRPNFSALTADQQQAMAEWVRGGGRLLLWPGTDPIPPTGPLIDLLPARFGQVTTLKVDEKTVAAAGLPARFGEIAAREMTAAPAADKIPLFGGAAAVVTSRVGYGMVAVLPFDASSLRFSEAKQSEQFWKPVMDAMLPPAPDASDYGYRTGNPRQAAAQSAVADVLGDVPGAGQFGFGYVVAVLLGMMVVVGPLDWLVLRKLGRQPWTWATTAGWILLVTLGAVYAGQLLKSGDLHYRTLRVIDEIDGRQVAAVDILGLYSPRTQDYGIDAAADSWWQPLNADANGYYSSGLRTDIDFTQDARGNRPTPMTVNVWNLRFLRGEQTLDAPAAVAAELRVVQKGKSRRLVGTITNGSGEALEEAVIYLKASRAKLGAIGPGKTVAVDAPLLGAGEIKKINPYQNQQYQPYTPAAVQTDAETAASPFPLVKIRPSELGEPKLGGQTPDARALTTDACEIADGRSDRIEAMFASGDSVAVVYAVAETPAVAGLTVAGGIERHRTIYRAVVRLASGQ